jgi:hypothetical protein
MLDKKNRPANKKAIKKKTNFTKCPFCGNKKAATWEPELPYGGFIICNAESDLGLKGCGASTGWAVDEMSAWAVWEKRS